MSEIFENNFSEWCCPDGAMMLRITVDYRGYAPPEQGNILAS